jgi:hypothetical protein
LSSIGGICVVAEPIAREADRNDEARSREKRDEKHVREAMIFASAGRDRYPSGPQPTSPPMKWRRINPFARRNNLIVLWREGSRAIFPIRIYPFFFRA